MTVGLVIGVTLLILAGLLYGVYKEVERELPCRKKRETRKSRQRRARLGALTE